MDLMKIIGNSRRVQGFTCIVIVIFSMGLSVVVLLKPNVMPKSRKC